MLTSCRVAKPRVAPVWHSKVADMNRAVFGGNVGVHGARCVGSLSGLLLFPFLCLFTVQRRWHLPLLPASCSEFAQVVRSSRWSIDDVRFPVRFSFAVLDCRVCTIGF